MLKTKKDLPSAGTEVQLQSFLFAVAMASGSCARAQRFVERFVGGTGWQCG